MPNKDNSFYVARIVNYKDLELLKEEIRDDFLKAVYKGINNELQHELFSRVEGGEKIVSLSPIKEDEYDFYSRQYRRYVKIRDLVRCKDCKYNKNLSDDYGVDCDVCYQMADPLGFCNYGEPREEVENDEDN